MKVRITPQPFSGTAQVRIPPSKSMAHRAILCASLAKGVSRIRNIDYSDDILATIHCMELLGAKIERQEDSLIIEGVSDVRSHTAETVDCGESGSTLRFLIPLFTLCGRPVRFTGRNRLLHRPQGIYETIYRERGLAFSQTEEAITAEGALPPGQYELDGNVSSQFITGLLFTLPLLPGDSVIKVRPPFESRSYVLLTLQVLEAFGIRAFFNGENMLEIPGGQQYRSGDYTVEGDFSQLAFFAVLGAAGRNIRCTGMRTDSRQGDRVILDILSAAGAKIHTEENGCLIEKSPLTGREISIADCPDLGPILTILAMYSDGTTVICDAERLRYKESDRIDAMEQELKKLHVAVSTTEGSITITGKPSYSCEETLFGHNDHRIVMSLAVAAVCGGFSVVIDGAECIRKSYPGFFRDLEKTGVAIEVIEP